MHLSSDSQSWRAPMAARMAEIPELISRSLPMQRICEQIPQMGRARLILVEGEPGTGKQLLARHIRGLRPGTGSFVAEEAVQLFGDAEWQSGPRGERLLAAVERAAQGIVLLRGIDELNSGQQTQLLRFIRSFETSISLGEPEATRSQLQILCTSRRQLRSMVLGGSYLPELYYRLSAVRFALPPLRERKEDMPGLVQFFIEAIARERRRPLQGLGPGALATLLHHRWPGNVRELESVLRAACFSAEGQWLRPIDLLILPLEGTPANGDSSLPQDLTLSGVMRRHVQRVLKMCAGNKARAAAHLGISRSTLYRMLEAEADTSLPVADAAENGSEEEHLPDEGDRGAEDHRHSA
jgi:two-component system response regulator AtoC